MKRLYALILTAGLAAAPATSLAQPDAPDEIADAGAPELDAAAAAVDSGVDAAADTPPAPPTNPAEADPAGTALKLYSAVRAGQWLAAFGFGLMFLVLAARLLLVKVFKLAWFGSKPGGYLLGYGTAAVVTFALSITTGAGFSWGLVLTALSAGIAATGGWSAAWDFVEYLGRKITGDPPAEPKIKPA